MQSDMKEICKLTALRTQEDEQLYRDISHTVFASVAEHLRRPKSLITKLKGVGSWVLRRKRMKIIIDVFPPNFEKTHEDFTSRYGIVKHENKIELHKLFVDRLAEYDRYILERDRIRKIRYESQPLLVPNDGKD